MTTLAEQPRRKILMLVGENTEKIASSLLTVGYGTIVRAPDVYLDKDIERADGVLVHFNYRGVAEEIAFNHFLYPPVLVYSSARTVNGRLKREVEPAMACPYWLTTEDPSETDIVDHFLEVSDRSAREFLAMFEPIGRHEKS